MELLSSIGPTGDDLSAVWAVRHFATVEAFAVRTLMVLVALQASQHKIARPQEQQPAKD